MKIGIVGASEEKWSDSSKPRNVIYSILDHVRNHALIDKYGDIIDSMHQDWRFVNMIDWSSTVMVSGGCPNGGVDIWAEEEADKVGIKKEIYRAEVNQWGDEVDNLLNYGACPLIHDETNITHDCNRLIGFKSRNIQIAEAVDILYVISPKCVMHDLYPDWERGKYAKFCPSCKGTGRVWNGGEWTGNYAEKLGKKVVRITI